MGKALNTIFWELAKALRKISKNPALFVGAGILDVLFFFVLGFMTRPVNIKIMDYIVIIGTAISEKAPAMTRGESISSIIASDYMVGGLAGNLVILFAILAVVSLLVYLFFHGVAWQFSSRIAGRKIHVYKYMKEFLLVNIFWMALYIVYYFISLFADLREASLRSFGMPASNAVAGFSTIFLVVIAYFAVISYTLTGKYKTWEKISRSFSLGVHRAKYILPASAIVFAVIFIFGGLANFASTYGDSLMVAVGVITIIPAMTLGRVYITSVVEKAEKAKR